MGMSHILVLDTMTINTIRFVNFEAVASQPRAKVSLVKVKKKKVLNGVHAIPLVRALTFVTNTSGIYLLVIAHPFPMAKCSMLVRH